MNNNNKMQVPPNIRVAGHYPLNTQQTPHILPTLPKYFFKVVIGFKII